MDTVTLAITVFAAFVSGLCIGHAFGWVAGTRKPLEMARQWRWEPPTSRTYAEPIQRDPRPDDVLDSQPFP